jgi:hypothetical protein
LNVFIAGKRREVRRRLNTKEKLVMETIFNILKESGLNEEEIEEWYDKPLKVFDDVSPREMVRNGWERIVVDVITDIRNGGSFSL